MVGQPARSFVREQRPFLLGLRMVTVASAVLFAALVLPLPSHAAANDPVITSPGSGSVMPNRWDGTVTVNLGAALSDEYWYSFECDDDEYVAAEAFHDHEIGSGDPVWTISASQQITGPATCEATVTGYGTGAYAAATWTVLGPSVTFSSVEVSADEFFPIIRDGYADSATLEWSMTADAAVRTEVRDGAGGLVKAATLGRLAGEDGDYGYEAHQWTWDGLRQDGTAVTPGDYTLTVTATGDDGIARSASRTVTAVTGVRESDWKTTRRSGTQASKITRTRGCVALYRSTSSAVTLDCTRGRKMVGTWRFALPADAVSIKYKVRGRYWGMQPRVVTKRPSVTRYEVKIRVPRGTVTRIDKVIVRYKTRTPI